MSTYLRGLSTLAFSWGAAGCAAFPASNIPGLYASPIFIGDEIKSSDVLQAVTCQISEGIRGVEQLKSTVYAGNKSAEAFIYQGGNGSFSGTIETKITNSASVKSSLILAGLPTSATGNDSTLGPGLDGNLGSTTKRQDKLTFSITPNANRANDHQCQNLKVRFSNNDIAESLVSHFVNTVDAATGAQTKTFNMKSVDTTLTFIITKTIGIDIGATTYPAAPYTISFVPSVDASRTRTGTYVLNFKLPTAQANEDNEKRLTYCTGNGIDQTCEEVPFSMKQKDEYFKKLRESAPKFSRSNGLNTFSLGTDTVTITPSPLPSDNEGPAF